MKTHISFCFYGQIEYPSVIIWGKEEKKLPMCIKTSATSGWDLWIWWRTFSPMSCAALTLQKGSTCRVIVNEPFANFHVNDRCVQALQCIKQKNDGATGRKQPQYLHQHKEMDRPFFPSSDYIPVHRFKVISSIKVKEVKTAKSWAYTAPVQLME